MALVGLPAEDTLIEFKRAYELSRPVVRREVKLVEDARAVLNDQLARTQERIREVEQQLRDTKIARHTEATRADRAQARLRKTGEEQGEMGCELALHGLIAKEWRALTPADRRAHPLGGYVLTPQFVEMVEQQPELAVERVAWVCAMIACRYAQALGGIAPHALLDAPRGTQIERDDGAKAWRASLKRIAPAAPRLHYWIRPDGVIEYAAVGHHDTLASP
jgi:hypothetical protein